MVFNNSFGHTQEHRFVTQHKLKHKKCSNRDNGERIMDISTIYYKSLSSERK